MNSPKSTARLRRLLLLLIFVLTFEGLMRKLSPAGAKYVIFFTKDVLVFIIGLFALRLQQPPFLASLRNAYLVLLVLFIPVIVATALNDPVLALFGAKQYLLFPLIGIAAVLALHEASEEEMLGFFRIGAFLLIPTTVIALLQSRLPQTHWLNLSVEGGSLEAFSAGGKLRLASTFPFVAQYSYFLNAQTFLTAIGLLTCRSSGRFWRVLRYSLVPALILGSYLTGSRTAVVGNIVILSVAAGLALVQTKGKEAHRILLIGLAISVCLLAVRFFSPSSFVAYSEREGGQLVGFSSENQDRILDALFGWWHQQVVAAPSFFGYGLGVMSNGTSNFSSYAAGWRGTGSWTETDFATTLFEGGFYLTFVWYGFRYYIIYKVVRRYLQSARGRFMIPNAFCVGFVFVYGVIGSLGIQPPLAIWWWLAVGTMFSLSASRSMPAEVEPGSDASLVVLPRGRSLFAEGLHGEPTAISRGTL